MKMAKIGPAQIILSYCGGGKASILVWFAAGASGGGEEEGGLVVFYSPLCNVRIALKLPYTRGAVVAQGRRGCWPSRLSETTPVVVLRCWCAFHQPLHPASQIESTADRYHSCCAVVLSSGSWRSQADRCGERGRGAERRMTP